MTGAPTRSGRLTAAILVVALAAPSVAAQVVPYLPPAPHAGYIGLGWRPGVQVVSWDGTRPARTRDYPVVTTVYECSPAEDAGFRVGDVVEVVDGQDGRILPLFDDSRPGAAHVVTVRRGGERLELTVTRTEQLRASEEPSDRCKAARRREERPPAEEPPPVAYWPGSPDRGYLGLAYEPGPVVSYDEKPIRAYDYAVITNVYECSPAAKAGFRVGDLLVVVNGRDGKILPIFERSRPGLAHVVTVRRGEEELKLTVTETEKLQDGERPSERCNATRSPGRRLERANGSVARRRHAGRQAPQRAATCLRR